MIGMINLKLKRVGAVMLPSAHLHHLLPLLQFIVVVLNVQIALSMIQIHAECVVDMVLVIVHKVSVAEKDHVDIQEVGIKEDILVYLPIKHAVQREQMLLEKLK